MFETSSQASFNTYENNQAILSMEYSDIRLDRPPRFLPYKFEIIDWPAIAHFVTRNWYWGFMAAAVYVVTIFGLQAFMAKRKAFDLRRGLFLWNLGLGIFSMIGFARSFPGLLTVLTGENGFHNSLCLPVGLNMPEICWGMVFVFSKYVELGDTVFIVLRKKPLVFLQWYHHVMTLLLCWLNLPLMEPIQRYYICMNYAVHSIMYPYFSLKAYGVDIPRWVSNFISTCQLSQMLMGFFVNVYSAYLFSTGVPCRRFGSSILYSSIVYGSFMFLFGKLFIDVFARSRKIANKAKLN